MVLHDQNIVEFFLGNTRKHELIQVHSTDAVDLILTLDGSRTLAEIADKLEPGEAADLRTLLTHLESRGIITDAAVPLADVSHRRVLSFLGDFARSSEDVQRYWQLLREAHVVIFGVGAVGSWIAYQLAQTGVGHLVLCDHDVVEPTNLNRQLFQHCEVGQPKVEALARRLRLLDPELTATPYQVQLDESTDVASLVKSATLVINAADYPSVDQTSEWIGRACMPGRIPHLIAGGYNLHLSLIGPTILPFETACVKCLEVGLARETPPLPQGMTRLIRPTRKIGSFAPMSALSASFTVMEAIKVITRCVSPANVNRRGEFDLQTRTIHYIDLPRRHDCEWCGSQAGL